ncbi:MAG: phosphatidylserine decarboxylase [Sulfurimonas sp.]|uniref:phosphatidylserine decarboxylase n=1 Tax=Sulfurimonas sp. TaxID=2022749 RepID=UPI0026375614|nr:phosphatidylserine decarboxylase [Sulfurimonas sp.]MCW8895087.1 phosphatidylserine decarboxylase [Sulfurimonas sp.]MCW8953588.1 phosphatidylserine decarboxylase [Sulfurimonas sp.]MCW9066959.1 phosphatidylserine decarboxylase [Sulfurimonas sp.]
MSRHITSAISQTFGKFANREFPKGIQNFINNGYVKIMGLDMSEFHSPETYRSLNALFTRKLKEDRAYSLDADDFISPCDSWISECGNLDKEYALQIKGMSYKCDDFIGDEFTQEEKNIVHDGTFVNFYLSPKDYHRYHIPTNLKVLKAVHVPGKFYPVNVPSLNKRVNLFIENERVVLHCETSSGKRFFMILVSALNVGVMQVSFEPKIKTNADAVKSSAYSYENLHLNKGDDFGCFEMGSTIVILAEKETLELNIKAGDNVKYGETIAKIS